MGQNNTWGWSGGGGGGGRVKIFANDKAFTGILTSTGGKGGATCGGVQCTVGLPGTDGTTNVAQTIPKAFSTISCGGF